jgi:hypothetical protein
LNPPADVQRWAAAAQERVAAAGREFELRKQLLAKYFPGLVDTEHEGAERVPVGTAGHQLKAEFALNYRLGKEAEVRQALQAIALADPAGGVLAERLVAWKPELRVGERRKLPEALREIIDQVLTTSPSTPALELVEPR